MEKGAGKRWLGDALVDCFVGSESEQAEGVAGGGAGVAWPGADGGEDEDFGVSVGNGAGQMDEDVSNLLKKVSVPGAENVDFLDRGWVGLV